MPEEAVGKLVGNGREKNRVILFWLNSHIISRRDTKKTRKGQIYSLLLAKKCVFLPGRMHTKARLDEGPRIQIRKDDKTKQKQNKEKENVTPEKGNMSLSLQPMIPPTKRFDIFSLD